MGKSNNLISVFLCGCLAGCAVLEPHEVISPDGGLTEKKLSLANSQTIKIKRYLQSERAVLDTIPIGAMMPIYNPDDISIPENWRYCNGDLVDDKKSPFNGRRVPNITDNRFMMFTKSSYGDRGGSNNISTDGAHQHEASASWEGAHDHGGQTLPPDMNGKNETIFDKNDSEFRLNEQNHSHPIRREPDHTHRVTIERNADHDHGGDKKPKWFGVACVIKIK